MAQLNGGEAVFRKFVMRITLLLLLMSLIGCLQYEKADLIAKDRLNIIFTASAQVK